MKTHKFSRKPFYVDAVRVSEANIEEVAEWCEGEILTLNDGTRYIKVRVHRPLTERQTQAFLGDWVLYAGTGFKVYNPKAFDKSFEKVKTLTKAQADEAGITVPHEPRPPKKHQPIIDVGKAVRSVTVTQKGTDHTVTINPDEKPPIDEADALIAEVLKD